MLKSFFSNPLKKTKDLFINSLGSIFKRNVIDESSLEALEEALLSSDVGHKTTQQLVDRVRASAKEVSSGSTNLKLLLRKEMLNILNETQRNADLKLQSKNKPTVLMLVGVNGVGKTTTAGKLCALYREKYGRNPVLAAADTYRAAAVEQLQEWGRRAQTHVIMRTPESKIGSDATAKKSTIVEWGNVAADQVVYDAIMHAKNNGNDLVICDTAGRLHNNVALMNELDKIYRVAGSVRKGAPDHVWLVLDATTGQNSVIQARAFKQRVQVNGVVVTKMDGTAKGGVVFAIANELRVPINYIGLGERLEDLKPFNSEQFVDNILSIDNKEEEGAETNDITN